MTRSIKGLSPTEAEILSRLAANGQTIFRVEDVRRYWKDGTTARLALSRLARGGWLKRLERGRYMLVPLEAGPEREWTGDAFVLAMHLLQPGAIAYWSALYYWSLTEQIPLTVFVQSPARKAKAEMVIDGVRYRFVTIGEARFFGLQERSLGGQFIWVTDREKTVLDATDRSDLCGGVGQLVQVLQGHWSELNWPKLTDYLARFGSGASYKRLGYLVEILDLPLPERQGLLEEWRGHLTTGVADLDPSQPAKGCIVRRWCVRDNLALAEGLKGQGV